MFGGRPSELILRPAWLSKPQPPRMTATPSHFCFFFVLFSISQIVQYEHLLLQMVVVVGRTNTLKKKKVPRLFCLANVINRNSTLSFTKDLNFPPTFKQFNSFIIAAGQSTLMCLCTVISFQICALTSLRFNQSFIRICDVSFFHVYLKLILD